MMIAIAIVIVVSLGKLAANGADSRARCAADECALQTAAEHRP
jgi:hypothetical protein